MSKQLNSYQQLWHRFKNLWANPATIRIWFDSEFYQHQVGQLPEGLSAESHYLRYGWIENHQPHPLFEAEFYRQTCVRKGGKSPSNPVLLHFCRHHARTKTFSIADIHPLGRFALEQCEYSEAKATERLQQWVNTGLPFEDLQAITKTHLEAVNILTTSIPECHQLALLSGSLQHWTTHAWLQHLPMQKLNQLHGLHGSVCTNFNAHKLTLLLFESAETEIPLEVASLMRWKKAIQKSNQCIVSDPFIASLLQGMGLDNVWLLPSAGVMNEWLDDREATKEASQNLGLPPVSGLQSDLPMVLGDAGPTWQSSLTDVLLALPSWKYVLINSISDAKNQASWLKQLGQRNHAIVHLNPKQPRHEQAALQALHPNTNALILRGEFCQTSLLNELQWYAQGCPSPKLKATPQPEKTTRWDQIANPSSKARVSVCISLHNYGHTIERALESIRQQSLNLQSIELIVVDDASTDHSADQTAQWLESRGQDFQRCCLLQHNQNGGLASARNTAFLSATADWCFVLDADNFLHPTALERCLDIAHQCSSETAVVHPWIAIQLEHSSENHECKGLHGLALWQRDRFLQGNHIDAMALVRRSAWNAIGGYTHIPGGWEDFDFWCCLIEEGWHGVCLPQVVCSYVAHNQSMLAKQTNNNLRWLCRLMQQRHPWLDLDPERTSPSGGAHSN